MAQNFPGPYQARLFYSTATALTFDHVQSINFETPEEYDPGESWENIAVVLNAGGNDNLSEQVDAYVALFRALYNGNMTLARAECWKYTEGTNDAVFIASDDIALQGSQGSGTLQTAAESIMTFRTSNGGSARFHWYQSLQSFGAADLPPFSNASYEAIRAYWLSSAGWAVGRDNGRLISAIGLYHGQNEHIFKKIYR
jgi:hypothetical protein